LDEGHDEGCGGRRGEAQVVSGSLRVPFLLGFREIGDFESTARRQL
jgi:hypothetical protein